MTRRDLLEQYRLLVIDIKIRVMETCDEIAALISGKGEQKG